MPAGGANGEPAPEKGQLSPVLLECDNCHVVHSDEELYIWTPPAGDNQRLCGDCLDQAEAEL